MKLRMSRSFLDTKVTIKRGFIRHLLKQSSADNSEQLCFFKLLQSDQDSPKEQTEDCSRIIIPRAGIFPR